MQEYHANHLKGRTASHWKSSCLLRPLGSGFIVRKTGQIGNFRKDGGQWAVVVLQAEVQPGAERSMRGDG